MATLAVQAINNEREQHRRNIELSDIKVNLASDSNDVNMESDEDEDIHTDDEETPLLSNNITFEEEIKNNETSDTDSDDGEELKESLLQKYKKKFEN